MNLNLTDYIACICEGSAEEVIIDILLAADLLIFTRDSLLGGELIRTRGGEAFARKHLGLDLEEKVTVLRILDSRNESFRIPSSYSWKISDVYQVITSPEIEMLIILNEGLYKEYCKSGIKPSDYCKQNLHMYDVKTKAFVRDYFSDPHDLRNAIIEYKRVKKLPKGELCLADLLR